MTNNDDVIVYGEMLDVKGDFGIATGFRHKAAFPIKPINLSELAEDVIANTDRGLSWTKHDFEDGVNIFLSKIREAMK